MDRQDTHPSGLQVWGLHKGQPIQLPVAPQLHLPAGLPLPPATLPVPAGLCHCFCITSCSVSLLLAKLPSGAYQISELCLPNPLAVPTKLLSGAYPASLVLTKLLSNAHQTTQRCLQNY